MDKPTGGMAFPRPEGSMTFAENGMSLRDWFAGQALIHVLSGPGDKMTAQQAAGACYHLADAMIAERDK